MVAIAVGALPAALHAQAARKSMGLAMQGEGGRVLITHIDDGGPADKAGLKEGDEIQTIAGIPTNRLDPQVLRVIVDTAKVMKFVVWRDSKRMTFNVVPGMYAPPRPKSPLMAPSGAARST
jgi:predicted metalloprotease with PDZ domain